MKRTLKRILCILLILLTLFNFIIASNTYATEETEEDTSEETIWDKIGTGLGTATDGVVGILLMPAKIILLVTGTIGRGLVSELAEIDATSAGSEWLMSLDDIFFHNAEGVNKYPILNINFFKKDKAISSDGVISKITKNIAIWYYAIRNLAIIISLLVLVYVGMRMAMATIADDKAKYKKMFTDWIVGFVTIFLLHYIIILTINVNESLVTILSKGATTDLGGYMDAIYTGSLGTVTFTKGMAGAIIYVFMSVMILIFLFSYIKRMLTIAFLIVIAPIITVTYSVDKIGDRKISGFEYMDERIYV